MIDRRRTPPPPTPWLLALALFGLSVASPARAGTDPCNFADGAAVYSYGQVMACYESVPFEHDDLVNLVESLRAVRETSDLREVFEDEFGWRGRLAALDDPSTTEDYPNDFALQLAVVRNHKEFFNPHWRYYGPSCYTEILSAFMPFDFGSTVTRTRNGGQEQIVFIEAAPFWPDLYRAFTGIDAEQFVGLRVISINGVDPLEAFRAFGRNVLRFDRNDGENFNEVLQNGAYSVRTSRPADLPPDRPFDTYVFESANGRRFDVEMPWVFGRRSALGLFPSYEDFATSGESFRSFCRKPGAGQNPLDLVQPSTLRFEPVGGQVAVSLDGTGLDGGFGTAIDWAAVGWTGDGDDDAARVSDVDGGSFNGFPYFGTTWNTNDVWVGTDGHITFSSPDPWSSARDFMRHIGGPPRISAFFADLDTNCTGTVYVDVRTDRIVITWDGLPAYGDCAGSRPVHAQAVLRDSGTIELRYGQVDLSSAVIGIAEGWFAGPYSTVDYTADLPASFAAGAIWEEFSGAPGTNAGALTGGKDSGQSDADDELRFGRELADKRNLVAQLRSADKGRRAEFFEVPPGRTTEILPVVVSRHDGAAAYQLDDTTILRLEEFAGDWEDEVIAATDYACVNSERLLIDLRNNGGGSPQKVAWLTLHLFPERTEPADFAPNHRVLRGNPALDELAERARLLYGPGCWTSQEAACFDDSLTGDPMTEFAWAESFIEERGGVDETLSPLGFNRFSGVQYPGTSSIACPGKFRDKTLIVLSNGTGASAGHFFPEGIRADSTIVTMGGYRGEELVSGIARGGYTMASSIVWPSRVAAYEQFFGPPVEPMPAIRRDVRSHTEFWALYDHGLEELYVNAAPRGDLHIDVWSDSRATDAFVYGKAIRAVNGGKRRRR